VSDTLFNLLTLVGLIMALITLGLMIVLFFQVVTHLHFA